MNPPIPRRTFLGSSALAGVGLASQRILAAETGGGKKLRAGLIGCGGRGEGAAKDFLDACKILGIEGEIVAVADPFQERANHVGNRYNVPENKRFNGFDSYQKVIASDCEFVLMAAPPSFRPLHFAAAVEAGKHTFIEKPVAVDPVGVRAVIAAGEKAAQKGLAVVAGTQRRHQLGYLRNKASIDAGAIGRILGGVVQWNGTVPWIRRRNANEPDISYMARNWLNFTEVSGDHIVEQHVHNIDVAMWYLGRPPVSALGFGGRARRETGNQFDFFSVDFDFGDDIHIHSQCRQLSGAYGRVGETFTGSEGVCYGGGKLTGKNVSIADIKVDSDNPYVQEHVNLIRGVLQNQPLNEARTVAEATMAAIMGRISAYTGQLVRWNDVMQNQNSPFYALELKPTAADFEKGEVTAPEEVPPVPGTA